MQRWLLIPSTSVAAELRRELSLELLRVLDPGCQQLAKGADIRDDTGTMVRRC